MSDDTKKELHKLFGKWSDNNQFAPRLKQSSDNFTKKELCTIAIKWDKNKVWSGNNQALIRYVYGKSPRCDRRLNLKYFCRQLGITLEMAYRIGQIELFNELLSQEQKGRPRDLVKARRKIEKRRISEPLQNGVKETYQEMAKNAGEAGKKTKGGGKVSVAAGEFYGK